MFGGKTPLYRMLVWMAIGTALFVVVVTGYQLVFVGEDRGNMNYRRANLRLEDRQFNKALAEFDALLTINPEHPGGQFGRALALMGLQRNDEAMLALNQTLADNPQFAAAYANRGILLDRMGLYPEALSDYRKALDLDASMGDGPGWLTRFFRSQFTPLPTIVDRADYLEAELSKPVAQRLMRVPELDQEQRSYKVEGRIE